MATHYHIKLMPEFLGQEINDDSKCYRIVRIEESMIGKVKEIKESIVHTDLTKQEANRLIYQLDHTATLAV